MNYLSAWQAQTEGVGAWLEGLKAEGMIEDSDTIWAGPSGDYVINPEDGEDYADYSDSGTVGEWLAQTEG
jgi:hypothetical protein